MSDNNDWKLGTRRGFLRAAALSGLAVPFLNQRAYGQTKPPTRLIIMTAMNGLVDSNREAQFQCTGGDTSLTLAPQFAALEALKSKVVAFRGLNNMTLAGSNFVANGHDPAIGSLLTAQPGLGGGWSVDQFIASQLGTGAAFKNISIRLTSSPKSGFHAQGGAWLPGVSSPQTLLGSIFSKLPSMPGTTTTTVDPQVARTRNVLDFVRAQNTALRAQLCGTERVMLDSHIDAIERARKAVVDVPPPPVAGCAKPAPALNFDAALPENMAKVRDAHVEIIAMAAACQLTPVVSYCLRGDGDNERYPFLSGVNPGAIFHDYAHGSSEAKTIVNGFMVSSFCNLVKRLAQLPEGTGTVLDNSLVMLVSDQRFGGEAAKHDVANLPVVLAGGAGGRLKGGRMLAYNGESFHKLLTSVCQLVGVNVNSFGQAGLSAGGLPRLIA